MQHLNPGAFIVTRIATVALLTPLFSSESAALDNLDFENAVESAEKMPRLYSLLISYQGDLIVEKYFNGMGANQAVNVKSVSKSVLSALVIILTRSIHRRSGRSKARWLTSGGEIHMSPGR